MIFSVRRPQYFISLFLIQGMQSLNGCLQRDTEVNLQNTLVRNVSLGHLCCDIGL